MGRPGTPRVENASLMVPTVTLLCRAGPGASPGRSADSCEELQGFTSALRGAHPRGRGAKRRDIGQSYVCVSLLIVKLMVQVRLLPTPVQAAALEVTLHAC